MPAITCPACGQNKTAAAYYHKCSTNGGYWFTVKLNPQIDTTTGMPKPIECPDGLTTNMEISGTPASGTITGYTPGCTTTSALGPVPTKVYARTLYCYGCKVVTIYPATPAG